MKKTILIVSTLISLVFATINAQNNDDVKYVPKSNLAKKEKQKKEASADIFKKNYAAYELFLLGRGVVAFSYERLFGERITVGIGLGTSYMKDIIAGYTAALMNENNDSYSYTQIMNSSKFKAGKLFLNGSVKYLFGDNEDKFFYLGLDYRKWGYSAEFDVTNVPINQTINSDNIVNFDFSAISVKWGMRILNDGNKVRFYADYYFGVGVKFTKYDSFVKSGTAFDPINMSQVDVYSKAPFNKTSLYIMGGLTIGIAF